MYQDFPEAMNEIARDLAELGVTVHPETMQDKDVADDDDYITKELANYIYTVLHPDYTQVAGTHDEWVAQEWQDRLVGHLNPGRAWKLRPEIWEEFLEVDGKRKTDRFYSEGKRKAVTGKFSYSYSMRMGGPHIQKICEELIEHPNSRQLYLPVWREIDETRRGKRRVPCSLGYHFMNRDGKLNVTYMMRSCDFHTHYANDVALATMLLTYIAGQTDLEVGTFTHYVGSLHVYAKDVADVF
jgi:thymidylate synthase